MNSGSMVDPSANSSEVSIQSTLPSFRAIKPSRLAAMWIVTRESIFAIAGVRSAPNDQSSAQQILDRFFQTLEVDRFCQVLGETSGAGFVHIVFHSEPAQRDSAQAFAAVQLAHQIVTAAIRQTDIADQEIELLRARFLYGLLGRVSERDFVTAPLKHQFHPGARVPVIVHHQQAMMSRYRSACVRS